MQRKAYATGAAIVAVLAVGAVGCTGGSGEAGAASDSKPGAVSAEAATAPPGTHRNLPEPCGAVDAGVLKAMLPGAEGGSPSGGDGGEAPGAYEGEQAVTYDNDRRVGCRWKSSTGLGSRHLLVDFERVVSYDPAVSDDKRAELLFEDMALEAGIPDSAPRRDGSGTEDAEGAAEEPGEDAATDDPEGTGEPEESGSPSGTDDGNGETDGPDATTGPSAPAAEPAPRPLAGIGDAAYIDDELVTADSGVHRDITLVFRTGNVLVTIEYEQWVTDKRRKPDSAELQEKARELAEQLAGEFED